MTSIAPLAKLVALIAIIITASGCNTMTSSLDNIKYGKLYTMQQSLQVASAECTEVNRQNALNWAVIGYQDLDQSRNYIDRNSQEYQEVRAMMRNLSVLSSRRNNDANKLCHNISIVAGLTKDFLAGLNQPERPILVAAK